MQTYFYRDFDFLGNIQDYEKISTGELHSRLAEKNSHGSRNKPEGSAGGVRR